MYEPNPIDTSGISLPEHLQPLVEKLAEHVHEVWALQRFGDGWVYGETRDDEKKAHPDLVPYDRLSDSEKEYDQRTVEQTLGFQVMHQIANEAVGLTQLPVVAIDQELNVTGTDLSRLSLTKRLIRAVAPLSLSALSLRILSETPGSAFQFQNSFSGR